MYEQRTCFKKKPDLEEVRVRDKRKDAEGLLDKEGARIAREGKAIFDPQHPTRNAYGTLELFRMIYELKRLSSDTVENRSGEYAGRIKDKLSTSEIRALIDDVLEDLSLYNDSSDEALENYINKMMNSLVYLWKNKESDNYDEDWEKYDDGLKEAVESVIGGRIYKENIKNRDWFWFEKA